MAEATAKVPVETDAPSTKVAATPAVEIKKEDASWSWFGRAYKWLVIGGGVYVCFLLLLLVPFIQRNAIFLHNVRFPLFADFSAPERYGLAPFKTRNFAITTPDEQKLGAWHVLPNSNYYAQLDGSFPPAEAFGADVFDSALRARPTVLFLHGNAGNRALSLRTSLMSSLTTALDVNALIIDYRGFGDSTGSPTEAGVLIDARAAWDWILERNGGDVGQIAIAGQSLGTGVGSALVSQLGAEGVHPPVLALLSPYSSIPELLKTYSLFRLLPILSPLRSIPLAQNLFTSPRLLRTRFDSLGALSHLDKASSTKVLLAHARNDGEIPVAHSRALFDGLLAAELGGEKPAVRANTLSLEGIQLYRAQWAAWKAREDERLERAAVPGWGEIKRFKRAESAGEVVFLEALYGGHDHLGGSEGVVALLGNLWGL